MNIPIIRNRGWTRLMLAAGVAAVLGISQSPASAGGGTVLPSNARFQGYSLADMATAVAQFTASENALQYYPMTPFQILHFDPSTLDVTVDASGGVTASGQNSLKVSPGTSFYLPIDNVDDSPPVLGTFPSDPSGAEFYFFDLSQVGGKDFEVVVDGEVTAIGPNYLVGPLVTPPLPDGGGTHVITLGVFLSPMSAGTHTVTIRGGYYGALIALTYPFPFYAEEFTYTVEVVLPGK